VSASRCRVRGSIASARPTSASAADPAGPTDQGRTHERPGTRARPEAHGAAGTLIEAADRDYRLYALSDGTEDPDEQARDVLLGRIFPRRAQVIDTATLRGLLSP
jgi:hypothetical protein